MLTISNYNSFINKLSILLQKFNLKDYNNENIKNIKETFTIWIYYCEHNIILYIQTECYIINYNDYSIKIMYDHQWNFEKEEFIKIDDYRNVIWGFNKYKNCYNEICCQNKWNKLRFYTCNYSEDYYEDRYQIGSYNPKQQCINYFNRFIKKNNIFDKYNKDIKDKYDNIVFNDYKEYSNNEMIKISNNFED